MLYTSNCLVDGRWTVKLSQFGLEEIFCDLRQANLIKTTHDSDDSNHNLL